MNLNGSPPIANTWKYAGEVLDYGIDWYYTGDPPWLQVDESIIDNVWSLVNPPDGNLVMFNQVFTSTGTGLYLMNGSVGYLYTVQSQIQTDKGRVGIARFEIVIR